MKKKVAELSGRALDHAVELANGTFWSENGYFVYNVVGRYSHQPQAWYSSCSAGDDIIDREKISTTTNHSGVWVAFIEYNYADEQRYMVAGTTRREAAMRCYVLSKLGAEVDVPDQLLA